MLGLQRQQVEATHLGNGISEAHYEDHVSGSLPPTTPVASPPPLPAGWYADPSDSQFICYWDGRSWDQTTRQKPVTPGSTSST